MAKHLFDLEPFSVPKARMDPFTTQGGDFVNLLISALDLLSRRAPLMKLKSKLLDGKPTAGNLPQSCKSHGM